jgi:hypothetical protein
MVPTTHSSAAVSNDNKQARAVVTFDRRVGANKIEENGHELGLQTWATHQQKEHSPSPKDTSDSRDVLVEGTMRNSNCAKPRKTTEKTSTSRQSNSGGTCSIPTTNTHKTVVATKGQRNAEAKAATHVHNGVSQAAPQGAPQAVPLLVWEVLHTHTLPHGQDALHTRKHNNHTPSTSRSHQATSARTQLTYLTGQEDTEQQRATKQP